MQKKASGGFAFTQSLWYTLNGDSPFLLSGGDFMDSQQKYLYILFSATPYRMGRWIRFVTGEPYNHVSIATEDDLRECYSFARRYCCTPFYGGFVTEHPERYHNQIGTSSVRLYRLPLTSHQWDILQDRLSQMRRRSDRYLYNHLSAMAAPLHRRVRVRMAFTCAEFTVSILSSLGFDFDANRFYTIGDIARRLEDYHIYTGDFPGTCESDNDFFQPRPMTHTFMVSTRDLLRLFWRRYLQYRV